MFHEDQWTPDLDEKRRIDEANRAAIHRKWADPHGYRRERARNARLRLPDFGPLDERPVPEGSDPAEEVRVWNAAAVLDGKPFVFGSREVAPGVWVVRRTDEEAVRCRRLFAEGVYSLVDALAAMRGGENYSVRDHARAAVRMIGGAA